MTNGTKTIRDVQLKEFMLILGELAQKYQKINMNKCIELGRAIQEIKKLGSTEFKKKIEKNEKMNNISDYIVEMYKDFINVHDKVSTTSFAEEQLKSDIKDVKKTLKTLIQSLKTDTIENEEDINEQIEDLKTTVKNFNTTSQDGFSELLRRLKKLNKK